MEGEKMVGGKVGPAAVGGLRFEAKELKAGKRGGGGMGNSEC
jgi:hypothetical protein